MKLLHRAQDWASTHKSRLRWGVETLLAVIIVLSFIALCALIFYYARPIKLATIKVPVATNQASYYAGEQVRGIFFGDIHYEGNVKILREVFCSNNYKQVIKPPADSANGDFFDTQSIPRKLEGIDIPIGTLPADVPLGSNCVLQFTNVYEINTPFGNRHEEYQYYTQNFSIVTEERRETLEDPNDTGGDTETIIREQGTGSVCSPDNAVPDPEQQPSQPQSEPQAQQRQEPAPEPQQPPQEPVEPPRECGFNLLGIRLFCD